MRYQPPRDTPLVEAAQGQSTRLLPGPALPRTAVACLLGCALLLGGCLDGDDGSCKKPLSLPIPGCAPVTPTSTGDPYVDCVARINQLRSDCQCLPPLQRWTEAEACADAQAQYDFEEDRYHAGFTDNICSPRGSAQNECPGWGSVSQVIDGCLQMMWDEGPGEPYSEHGHYINMTNPSYTKVACGFYTTPGGAVWAVQNFSP